LLFMGRNQTTNGLLNRVGSMHRVNQRCERNGSCLLPESWSAVCLTVNRNAGLQ
jgi:hypothetical protein